jgi:hypothetical protein
MCFKRYNIFAKAFNSTIKDIHLALAVKTFFGDSTPMTGLSTESSPQNPVVSIDIHQRHRRKGKRERKPARNS